MPPREDRPAARVSPFVERPPRARAKVALGLRAAMLVAVITGCGSRTEAPSAAPAAAPVIAAPARPASVRIEGRLRDVGSLRASLPPMVAAAMPTRASELLAAGCALPPALGARIADDAHVAFAFARLAEDQALGGAFTARVRVEAGATPLGAGTPLVEAGEPGVRWVGAAPLEGRAALALVGDALVCAESAELARALGPYLARSLLPQLLAGDPGAHAPLHATLLPGAVSEDLRRFLSAELALATLKLRQAAARQAHAAPPPTGATPATSAPLGSVAIALRDALRPAVESLAGAGSGSITIDTDHSQLVVRVTVDAPPGSPFAAALGALPRVARSTLTALPADAAIGAVFGADPAGAWSVGDALRAAVDAAAGTPISAAEGARIDAALGSLGAARGSALVVAAGVREGRRFALLGAANAASTPDAARLQAALDTPVLSGALTQALGCAPPKSRASAPGAVQVGESVARSLRVCDGRAASESRSTPTQFALASHPTSWSLYVSESKQVAEIQRLAAEAAVSVARAAAPAHSDPAIAALPERASLGVVVRPDSLGALVAASLATEGATPAPPPTNDAALLLALDHDADRAHLTLVAPSPAIAAFLGAFGGAAGASR